MCGNSLLEPGAGWPGNTTRKRQALLVPDQVYSISRGVSTVSLVEVVKNSRPSSQCKSQDKLLVNIAHGTGISLTLYRGCINKILHLLTFTTLYGISSSIARVFNTSS